MSDNTTAARPYARAVFETAQAESAQAAWTDVLAMLTSVVANADIKTVLAAPGLGGAAKGELLIEICGDKLKDSHRNFVRLLAENGRLEIMPEISELYEMFRAEAESKVEAKVTSAYPLSDTQMQALTDALKKRLGCEVTLVAETDASIIGGLVIRAGDLVIDGSANARLGSLAQALIH
ncbi:MAG: F0F1 ATP synthase subunit delta [Gammaproteobacteria bacterium]|nr:MAG: F0F1 ATP synthase subunit delta [Gammaproteobacteria bacterium]